MEITYSFFIIRFSMKGNFDRLILLMRVHASVIREVDAINRAIFGFSESHNEILYLRILLHSSA